VRRSSLPRRPTIRARTRCRKHAYAPPVLDAPPSAAFSALFAFVSPAHASASAANTYDVASRPSVTGDDPVNGSDPSGRCSSFNFSCWLDNQSWIQQSQSSPNGLVSVDKTQVRNLLIDNGWNKGDATTATNSFDWSRTVDVLAIPPDLAWWRYSSRQDNPGRLAFGTPDVYTSPKQAVADLNLSVSGNTASYFWALEAATTIPAVYGYVKGSANGRGVQIVAPTYGSGDVFVDAGPVPTRAWESLAGQYEQVPAFPAPEAALTSALSIELSVPCSGTLE
jgi:hypothetical protein